MNTVDLSATFSGPNNIINFFMDDALTSLNFPPEAGSDFIDRIQVTTFPAVGVPGPIVCTGLAVAFSAWWRRRKKIA